MSEENKAVVRQIEEAWNAGNLDALDQFFAPNFTPHNPPGAPTNLAEAKAFYQMAISAFPDRKTTVEDILGDGDQVAVRIRMTGTNRGGLPALGIPANDKPVDIEWIGIYRLQGGKVLEHRAVMDLMGLMQQIGPVPGASAR